MVNTQTPYPVDVVQVWYIVPPSQHQHFVRTLQQHMKLPDLSTAAGLAAVKTLLPLLPPGTLRDLGVRRILQKPGDIVLTCPVSITTLSLYSVHAVWRDWYRRRWRGCREALFCWHNDDHPQACVYSALACRKCAACHAPCVSQAMQHVV